MRVGCRAIVLFVHRFKRLFFVVYFVTAAGARLLCLASWLFFGTIGSTRSCGRIGYSRSLNHCAAHTARDIYYQLNSESRLIRPESKRVLCKINLRADTNFFARRSSSGVSAALPHELWDHLSVVG